MPERQRTAAARATLRPARRDRAQAEAADQDEQRKSARPAASRRPGNGKAAPAKRSHAQALLGRATPSLTDQAYSTLEEMIVTLKLPPGAAVSEAGLSDALGIGRTPIREALQRLARERLVAIFPRRGIFVTDINVTSQLRLLEVRRELERLIARSAARRATDEERRRFEEVAARFQESARVNDDVAFMRTDPSSTPSAARPRTTSSPPGR